MTEAHKHIFIDLLYPYIYKTYVLMCLCQEKNLCAFVLMCLCQEKNLCASVLMCYYITNLQLIGF